MTLALVPWRALDAQQRATNASRCHSAASPAATVTACRSLLRRTPNDAAAYRTLGNALALLGRRKEALSELYEAARLDPTNAAVWDELALAAYALGRHDEAVSYWDRSRRLDRSLVDGSPTTRALLETSRTRLVAARPEPTPTPPPALLRSGIGFPISDAGLVMTSGELIYRCPQVTLHSAAGEARLARIEAVDHTTDLAVIRVDGPIPPAIPFRGGSGPQLGEALFALPFPTDGSRQPLRGVTADPSGSSRERGKVLRVVGNVRADRAAPVVDAEGRIVAVFGRLDDRSRYERGRGDAPARVRAAVDARAVREFLRLDGVAHQVTRRGRSATAGQRELLRGRSAIRVECRK
jgi:hypothetical protein